MFMYWYVQLVMSSFLLNDLITSTRIGVENIIFLNIFLKIIIFSFLRIKVFLLIVFDLFEIKKEKIFLNFF